MSTTQVYHALIRTHHITSRRKISVLKSSAKKLNVRVVLRSGGVPGVMFVQGHNPKQVQQWVDVVHELRYKDFRLVSPVGAAVFDLKSSGKERIASAATYGSTTELDSVKEFGILMHQEAVMDWWRAAMGFTQQHQ